MQSDMTAKIRLYIDQPLAEGQTIPLDRAQAHYLFGVMRLGAGAALKVFDGQSGEYLAHVADAGKRGGSLAVGAQLRPLSPPPDVWLLFAPVKKTRTDFIVEKAVELGVARICPVRTEFTNSGRIQRERLQANAVEAAEQCGATVVPEVADLAVLDRVIDAWDPARRLFFCDETAAGGVAQISAEQGPAAILIGPEGGFSEAERARLLALPSAERLSLGPRILRAETAAVAALTLWQSRLGDWV